MNAHAVVLIILYVEDSAAVRVSFV